MNYPTLVSGYLRRASNVLRVKSGGTSETSALRMTFTTQHPGSNRKYTQTLEWIYGHVNIQVIKRILKTRLEYTLK